MSDLIPGYKINKKKLENLDRLRKKREQKVSKTKQKKLSQIAERNRIKQTRDSLFDKLQLHQLDEECMKLLIPINKKEPNNKMISIGNESQTIIPKKLRSVSAEKWQKFDVEHKQQNYIETDTSSNTDDEHDTIDNNAEIQILDVKNRSVNKRVDEFIFGGSMDCNWQCNKSVALITNTKQQDFCQNKQQNFFETLSRIKGSPVYVQRNNNIQTQRNELPIIFEEQPIMELINENPIVIITGETGSGKTTQVPQFLYEAGYTTNGHLIGITEPRRIAAINMANRVGEELGNTRLVSYQIRYDGNRTNQTKLLFMTDGVLLKEIQADCTLSRYSVIILDEAHERSIYTDVLIGLLSRISITRLKRNYPLKLVIMSATLRVNDFFHEKLFPQILPKIFKVDARQFPVSVFFEKRTPQNYLEAAYKKVCKIHEQYQQGGILVFLSGQNEVNQLINLLEQRYPKTSSKNTEIRKRNNKTKLKKNKCLLNNSNKSQSKNYEDEIIIDYDEFGIYDMDQEEQNYLVISENENHETNSNTFPPLNCLPLYSLLPGKLQKKIFEIRPDGSRICVISTNVAETSLTIPGIRYVIDSGKEKRRDYDPITGVSRLIITWCSKASADQRSGRAGRVQAGYTFRLYSPAVYEDMQKYPTPEILNKPIEQLVLFLKSMGFTNLANFPFPTQPKSEQIISAETKLFRLGALEVARNEITPLGRTMVQIPLAPEFAKYIISSFQHGLHLYAITLVSALSVREPLIPFAFINENTAEQTSQRMKELIQRKLWCAIGEAKLFGDLAILLNIIGASDYEYKGNHETLHSLGIRPKALEEIVKLRRQLVTILNTSNSLKEKLPLDFKMDPPCQKYYKKLRHIMVNCSPDKIAKRIDDVNVPKGAYKVQTLQDFVFIHPSSALFKDQPDFLLFQEIIQLSDKKFFQYVIAVESEWIPPFSNFVKTKSF